MNGSSVSLKEFTAFAVEIGHRYLAAGGPTSRIEEALGETALSFEIKSEVYATPTGLFISSRRQQDESSPVTLIGRIQSSSTDLAELIRLEKIMEQLQKRNISLEEAEKDLPPPPLSTKERRERQWVSHLSYFLLGFAASFNGYASWTAGLLSGVLCWLVGTLSAPLGQRWGWSGIFRDFIGCLFVFLLSGLLSVLLTLPADSLAIGTLILIVPGLSLTNAISELAEQNFVSGTAKLMKSILILLAMGIAFLLASDLAGLISPEVNFQKWGNAPQQSFYLQLICHSILLASFCGIFRVPYKYFLLTLIPGLLSWWVFGLFSGSHVMVLSSFTPALTVGFLSLLFSRSLKVPSQIFSVPGILSLVPGMLALSTFYSLKDSSASTSISFQVTIIAASITFGLFTARIPFFKRTSTSSNISES